MSIGTIWLASNIVLKGEFKAYFRRWKESALFWFLIGILALHLFGLIYTNDFNFALRDLNTKLPLFVIPISIIAFPIKKEWLRYILYFYIVSLCITSTINLIVDWTNPQADFRSISLFGSHIRYTILIVMGVLVGFYLFQQEKKLRLVWTLIILWLLFYVYQSQVFSGYVSILMLVIALLVYGAIHLKQKALKNSLLFSILVGLAAMIYFGFSFFSQNTSRTDFSNYPEKTPYGNTYLHDTSFIWYENNNHVMSFISEKELKESWNKRSTINYDSLDHKKHEVKSTLIRYMASKGLTKDRDGMKEMTENDIKNVELGYTNINQLSRSPLSRLQNLKNAIQLYNETRDPNGNSIIERIEHFKIGRLIVQDNWLVGVGTGDVQNVFNKYYEKTESKLKEENWNRAHNQFLTFWISFGIVGLILFTTFWFWFTAKAIRKKSFLMLGFALIAIGSFLSEDTIETQQGVTFIAFFIAVSYLNSLMKPSDLK